MTSDKRNIHKRLKRFFFSVVLLAFFLALFTICHTIRTDKQPSGNNYEKTAHKEPGEKFLWICTFNIQFLGNFKLKDNAALAELLKDYDIILIQEMVAPPVDGTYPDGSQYYADPESRLFLVEMQQRGFEFLLSSEDTGTGEAIHSSGTATEWWIAFYKPGRVYPATDLPGGFLAPDRSNHTDYERVPYAFPFRTVEGNIDFVIIPVHLKPGDQTADASRRKHEIQSIHNWIISQEGPEKDFMIAGDMNIENKTELSSLLPQGMISLNDECRRTNTLMNNKPPGFGAKPYDHILYFPEFSKREIDIDFDCLVVDLVVSMRRFWNSSDPYPGDPYNHTLFRQYFSDHQPVIFRLRYQEKDDD